MTSCEQCHFSYESLRAEATPGALRHSAREIRERLGTMLDVPGGVERLRIRPEATTWSALEYAGHVRDVLLVQHSRLYRALVEDLPVFTPMHRDERVVLGGYNDEDPATTATEVTIAADLFARVLARLDASEWSRKCIYPGQTEVDIAWLARNGVHEVVHHLLDIDTVIAAVSQREPANLGGGTCAQVRGEERPATG